MNKLTKAQETTKDELVAWLNEAKGNVQVRFEQMASFISDDLNGAIATYNEVVGKLESFRDELVGDMESYYDERSEKWQEGDAGSNYQSWKSDWEGLDVSIVDDVSVPDELTLDHAEALEQLSNEVDG